MMMHEKIMLEEFILKLKNPLFGFGHLCNLGIQ
jgi:hypothetical protein